MIQLFQNTFVTPSQRIRRDHVDDVPLHITGFHLGPDFSQPTVVVHNIELLAGLGLVRLDARLDLAGGIRPTPGHKRDLACKRRCTHQAEADDR